MAPTTRRAAVLGHPIAHSLSPALHRAAYAALGLDGWRYDAFDVTAEQLGEFMTRVDESWAGLSVTMPLKQAAIPLMDHVDPLADVTGAVNTILVQPGATTSLVGVNTDVYGLVTALREGLGERDVRTGVVLGAGATAASTLAAFAQLGCTSPIVYARSLGRTGALRRAAHRMGVDPDVRVWSGDLIEPLATADVVVATAPPHGADATAADLVAATNTGWRASGVLLDAAYDPRPTDLSAAWVKAGGVAVGGERMLLHQAVEQVRLMTGLDVPASVQAAMDAALNSAL